MANDSVGEISVDIVGNEKPIQKQVEGLGNTLKKPMEKLGATMAAAFSAAAIVKFGKEITENAAQVNAANSQMAQTFGELEDKARSVMSTVAKSSGIMETRLQGVGTSIYAFAKTSGMDSASAMSMMQDALQATADSAAYYDRSLEETAESLKSFLKGNYANDAALGISCTETTRNAAANKLYGKSFKDLSEAQKQLTLLQMVKDANKLSGAMGQAAREADGWENVTGNLKETWKQFQAVIGQPVLKAATAIVKQLTAALQKLTVYAKSATQEMAKLFHWDMSDISSAGSAAADSMSSFSDNAGDGTESINATTKAAEKLKKTVAGFDQLNILSSSDDDSSSSNEPETSANSTSDALNMPDTSKAESGVDRIANKIDGLKEKLSGLYKNSGLSKAVDNFRKQFDKIDFKQIGKNFQSIFTDLQPIAMASLSGVQKIAQSKLALIGTLFGGLARTAGNHIQTLSGGVAQWLSKDKGRIASYITEITGNVSAGIDNCTTFLGTMFDIYNDSLERMRPKTEAAIANMLSGFTTFAGSVGEIISGGFEIATGAAAQWAVDNKELIGKVFDDIQQIVNDCMNGIGKVFEDVGNDISNWWKSDGQEVWEGFCKIVGDLGTIFLNVFDKWIMPVWDAFTGILQSAWDNCIRPVLQGIGNTLTKLWKQIIEPFWTYVLKPIINQIVNVEAKRLEKVLGQVKSAFTTVFNTIKNVVQKFLAAINNLIDFITDVFKGDWDKAWNDIKSCFANSFGAIGELVKGTFNLLIDCVNTVWAAIYDFVAGVVNGFGGILEKIGSALGQDWGFSMPSEPSYIPHLAKGGLVKAPTLAMVGDNKGAAHDPEVVSPLSKLESMLHSGDPEIVRLLLKIIALLEHEESVFQNNIYLDSEVIERKLVKVRKRKQRRYGGAAVT